MPFFHAHPDRRTNEDVFFAYYPRLLGWAVQITHGDKSDAEDLVQDFYLRVTRITRPIDEMEQLEAYLFRVLRNLYIARVRRSGRDPLNQLSIVDYDSVEQGLAVADRRELLFAREHLRTISRYVCKRKSTVRSASVLILRFFHGYYPTEIMKILRAGRSSVDMLLQTARNEARLCLENPEALRCIVPPEQPAVSFPMKGEDTQQLFAELQEAIFSAAEGACMSEAALKLQYDAERDAAGPTTQELSHLVSCRICLERVNAILHLPKLADRSPEDGIGRDNSSGTGGGQGSGILRMRKMPLRKGPSIRKMERRARDLFEHRPRNLQIVVDGEVRTSQKITADINELRLKLARNEEPSFIEIMSEQGFCLAFLQVEALVTATDLEQIETCSFSDDRSLVLTLNFAAEGAIVYVLYRDPVMVHAAADLPAMRNATDTLSSEAPKPLHPFVSRPTITISQSRALHLVEQLVAWLVGQSRELLVLGRNPLLVTGIAVAIALCIWMWPQKNSAPISAIALLQHAEVSEAVAISASKPQIIYQKVCVKTARHSIERNIYRDTTGRRKQKPEPVDPQTVQLEAKLVNAGVDWSEPLSAATYQNWRDHVQVTGDSVQEIGKNLLTLTTTVSDNDVTQESLTVRESDFHPVARSISFRDSGNVEIAELDFNVMPWSAAGEGWFEPIPNTAASFAPRAHAAIHMPHVLSDLEIDEAELAARMVLNELHADTGEQISLSRSTEGIVIKGVVETNHRKEELLSHLAPIPYVHVSLLSSEEIGLHPTLSKASGEEEPIHVYSIGIQQPSALQQYLHTRGLQQDQLAPASDNLLDESVRILQLGVQLEDLQSRFTNANQSSTDEHAKLNILYHNYAESITAGIDANKQVLSSLGLVHTIPAGKGTGPKQLDVTFDEDLRRYRNLCLEMISTEVRQSRSAPVIADEILEVGDRLRSRINNLPTSDQNANN